MSNRIGHNNPPVDGYDDFDPDFGRALRFALMDHKLAGDLSPEQRHVGQIVGNFMPKDGKGLKLGVRKISEATGYGRTMAAQHLISLRIWHYLNVIAPAKKGGATTFETNISKEMALTKWLETKRKKHQQLEQEVSALEADGREAQLSAPRPDSSAEVSTPVPDSRHEVPTSTAHFQGKSVRSDPKSVRSRTGHTLKTLNTTASKQDEPNKIVPLNAYVDVDLNSAKLAKFGSVERGRLIVERFAKTVNKSPLEVLEQLHYDGGIHGYENVRIAVDSTADKNPDNPAAWYRKVLNGEASKNPGLQPPKQTQQPKVRFLTMAERSFPTC